MSYYSNFAGWIIFIVSFILIQYIIYQQNIIAQCDSLLEKQHNSIQTYKEVVKIQAQHILLLEENFPKSIENSPIHLYNNEL